MNSHTIINRICLVVIGISMLLSAAYAVKGDLVFHTDISRDFLVIQDMVTHKKLTLLGPRSGGISGIFHGPAWFYLNAPIFYLSHGNPAVVSWFWWGMVWAGVAIIFLVAKKLFSSQAALYTATIFGLYSIVAPPSLINPFPAVILSPIFFFFTLQYKRTRKWIHLLSAVLTLGFIIQFQMAFGIPVLLCTLPYFLFLIVKSKKYWHVLLYSALIIPLSTFLIFEVRHNFLQFRSVLTYLSLHDRPDDFRWLTFVWKRIYGCLGSISQVNNPHWASVFSSFLILVTVLANWWHAKKRPNQDFDAYTLFLLIFFGFWLVTALFRGEIWYYYHWPLIPLSMLMVGRILEKTSTKIAYPILILIMGFGLWNGWQYAAQALTSGDQNISNWSFYKKMARDVFADADTDFSYYVYTPDQYGYSPKYGMEYLRQLNPSKQVSSYEKKPVTYLLIGPEDENNQFTSESYWSTKQVNINRPADKEWSYANGYRVKKYLLTSEEQLIQSDPNLIKDLFFR